MYNNGKLIIYKTDHSSQDVIFHHSLNKNYCYIYIILSKENAKLNPIMVKPQWFHSQD